MAQKTDILGFAYAALVAAGGLTGYIKAGSVPSLIAGVTSGVLIGLGAFRAQTTGKSDLALFVAASLTVMMGRRYANSGKVMPSGLVAGISLLMAARYGSRYLNNNTIAFWSIADPTLTKSLEVIAQLIGS